ncbi:MAG: MMPL family transporter [Saprospiraceae bacterium]|nr:MMPL family transporter [Saprospiraceae bacterium]
MSNFFLFWYDLLAQKRLLTFGLIVSIFGLLAWQATHLQLKEDISQMMASGEESQTAIHTLENAAFSNRIMVLFSNRDTTVDADRSALIHRADSFVQQLNNRFSSSIKSLHYITPDSVIGELFAITAAHLPVFLEPSDYERIDSMTSPTGIEQIISRNNLTRMTPLGFALQGRILSDVLGLDYIALSKFQTFSKDSEFELQNGRLLSKNGHHVLLYFTPDIPSTETDQLVDFFGSLDQVIREYEARDNETRVYYFGPPAVAAGNARAIRSDITLTVSLTVILLLIIFLWYFKHWSAPLLIFVPTLFGLVFALAGMAWIKGSISVIALGSGSLILGIAVNYSLHFLTHRKHHGDLRESIKELAFPMIAGGLTTIAGFLCLLFVNAPVLQDLGLFAALSLTGASMATLIFLPHLVSQKNQFGSATHFMFKRVDLFSEKGNRYISWLFLLLTPIMFYLATKIEFESDMNAINYMSADLIDSRQQIDQLTEGVHKILYINSTGNTLDEALEHMEAASRKIDIWTTDSLLVSASLATTILPSTREQQRRIDLWKSYWTDDKIEQTVLALQTNGSASDFDQSSNAFFKQKVRADYTPLTPERSTFLRHTFLDQLISQHDQSWQITGLLNTSPEKSAALHQSISSISNVTAFDRQRLTEQLVSAVTNDFGFITFWTSLLVFVSLLIIYGRIELALISFWPMAISWIWILGLMTLFDIKFNVINIVLSTLIFALGDDYCIFTTDRLQKKYAFKHIQFDSTFSSITLSAITTIVGMGVLFLRIIPLCDQSPLLPLSVFRQSGSNHNWSCRACFAG